MQADSPNSPISHLVNTFCTNYYIQFGAWLNDDHGAKGLYQMSSLILRKARIDPAICEAFVVCKTLEVLYDMSRIYRPTVLANAKVVVWPNAFWYNFGLTCHLEFPTLPTSGNISFS